jgi:hypothetical protein
LTPAEAYTSPPLVRTYKVSRGGPSPGRTDRQNPNCTNFAPVGEVGANVASFADTGSKKKITYRHRVRAFNSEGDSASSNIAAATTLNR